MIAVALRPVALLVLMGLVVIPIELALRRIWPEGRLKRILFERNFDKRHPRAWVAVGMGAYVLMIALVAAYLELRPLLVAAGTID